MSTLSSRLSLLVLILLPLAAHALTTAFLYQGRLAQGGAAPTGSFDFTFTLYDAATDGAPVGDAVALPGVAVANGLFVVPLDFGAAPFQGADRWLEVAVRVADGVSYTVLAPRQPLAPTPYALFARAVNWDDILNRPAAFGVYTAGPGLTLAGQEFAIAGGGVAASMLADGAVTTAKLAEGAVTDAKVADVAWGKITGAPAAFPPSGAAGGDLTGTYPNPAVGAGKIDSAKILDGSLATADLADGAVTAAKLAADAASLAKVTNNGMRMNGTNVGIGTAAAGYPLGFAATLGDKIALYGDSGAHYGFGIQNALLQIHADNVNSAIAFGYGSSAAFTELLRIKGNGNVGIGTTSPAAKLDVNGAAKMTGFQLGSSATAGQVLTANAAGVGTWQALPAAPTTLPPTGPAGGSLTGTYPNPAIAAGAIGTAMLGDGQVTNSKLAADSVTTAKVADGTVTAPKLSADAASLAKVSGGMLASTGTQVGVGTATPATGVLLDIAGLAKMTGFQLGGSATAGQVLTASAAGVGAWQALPAYPTTLPPSGAAGGDLTGTYPNPTVGTGKIDSGKILDGTIAAADLADGAVTTAKILDANVTTAKLVDGAVTSAKIADATIAAADLADGAVTSAKILDATIAAADLAANAVTTAKILDANVTTAKLADGAVTSAKILDATIATADLADSAVTSAKILDATVATADLAANAVTSAKLASDAASLAKVTNGGMTMNGTNVGVGTTSAGFPLSFANVLGDKIALWGSTGNSYGFGIQSSLLQLHTDGSGSDIAFGYGSSSAMTETMRVKGNGNVGIGTSAPATRLDVKGMVKSETLRVTAGSTVAAPFDVVTQGWLANVQQGTHNYNIWYAGGLWQSFTAGATLSLCGVALNYGARDSVSNWVARLSIYEGEGTGGALLATQMVAGNGPITWRYFTLATPVAVTIGSKYTIFMDADITCQWNAASGNIYSGGTCNYGADYDHCFITYLDSGTSVSALSVLPGTGYVGILTGNPDYPLHVNGRVAGVGTYLNLSDARFKTHIRPLTAAITRIGRLQGVEFDWTRDGTGGFRFDDAHQLGFLAQEVEKVVPEAVTKSAGGVYSMSYTTLIPLLVEGMKEQQGTIDAQLRRLTAVEAENAALKARLEKLEAAMAQVLAAKP